MSDESAPRAVVVPFFDLNDLEVVGVGDFAATCASRVTPWLEGTAEHGIQAAAAALADCVLMYAASTCLPSGFMPVTVNMRLDFRGRPPALGSRLQGTATAGSAEDDLLLIRGEIEGPDGVVASATARSILVARGPHGPAPAPGGAPSQAQAAAPMAAPRVAPEPSGAILALAASRQIDLEAVQIGDGSVELVAVPHPDLERTAGVVHGGAIPVMGQLACAAVLESAMPGVDPRRLDVTVEYLRPTPVNRPLRINARVVHRTRRLVTTYAELVNADGKPSARIHETAALRPL